jgi:site-specific DNA recombinase
MFYTNFYTSSDKITQEDYQDMIEANNNEINELVVSKKELESLLSSNKVVENIQKLKHELAQFLNFDELTPEILHRLIDRIEIKADGTPKIFYRFSAPKIE